MTFLLRYYCLLTLYLLVIVSISSQSKSISIDKELQEKLNNVIKSALKRSNLAAAIPRTHQHPITSYSNGKLTSSLQNICDNAPNINVSENRTACCSPTDTRVLYNVKVDKRKIVMFTDKSKTPRRNDTTLPPILSLWRMQLQPYKLQLKIENNTEPAQCKEYFDGTLHVMGRKTTHNLYHVIADNYAPLVSQIMLDSIIDPDYLYLPRVFLNLNNELLSNSESVEHMQLMNRFASGGTMTIKQLDSVCFRRVVWGNGPYPFYQDTLVKLRRVIHEFSRSLMKEMFNIAEPTEYRSHSGTQEATQFHANESVNTHGKFLTKEKKPMNIVYYTRGTSGRGRTLRDEQVILNYLRDAGANVVFCCDDFDNVPYVNQISYAYYADIMVGMHGAGLVHGLFMPKHSISIEFKTVYGFTSSLFELINDAREGTHGQVDIKSYLVPGGHKPVDLKLVSRLLDAMYHAIKFNEKDSKNGTKIIDHSHRGDILIGHEYDPKNDNFNQILGPFIGDQLQECQVMLQHAYRHFLYTSYESYKDILPEMDILHCKQCYPYLD